MPRPSRGKKPGNAGQCLGIHNPWQGKEKEGDDMGKQIEWDEEILKRIDYWAKSAATRLVGAIAAESPDRSLPVLGMEKFIPIIDHAMLRLVASVIEYEADKGM